MANQNASLMMANSLQKLTDEIAAMLLPLIGFILLAGIVQFALFRYARAAGASRKKADLVAYLVGAGMVLLFFPIWGYYITHR